ncbi:MAG: SixA phosphatase family protein [Gemmataceae bacterium]
MNLYIIRHAEAVPLGHDGIDTDEARYLTPAGMASCRPLARTLRRVAPGLTALVTSPLVRARHTAEGIVANWGDAPPALDESPLLAPGGRRRKVLDLVREYDNDGLGLVGHNPDLSELVGWFLGDKGVGIDLEKAGVACLTFADKPAKGGAVLEWLVTPAWLSE